MNAKDLRKLLKGVPDDALVVLSSDPEGNRYRLLQDVDKGYNFDETNLVVGLTEIDAHLREAGYSDDDVIEGERCIILWPR
jgi:hypothetical protein